MREGPLGALLHLRGPRQGPAPGRHGLPAVRGHRGGQEVRGVARAGGPPASAPGPRDGGARALQPRGLPARAQGGPREGGAAAALRRGPPRRRVQGPRGRRPLQAGLAGLEGRDLAAPGPRQCRGGGGRQGADPRGGMLLHRPAGRPLRRLSAGGLCRLGREAGPARQQAGGCREGSLSPRKGGSVQVHGTSCRGAARRPCNCLVNLIYEGRSADFFLPCAVSSFGRDAEVA
mmetsp:Transcript_52946/g.106254  ORF Transcript_52946/g.106254 Transcript_52946/m.106254 type:complete len:232 (-) Transcript_52946:149-844(-)